MTIDEAISHALEVAERYERMEDSHDDKLKEECLQCAADHRQLAEWLTELADLKEKIEYCSGDINERIAEAEAEERKCFNDVDISYNQGYIEGLREGKKYINRIKFKAEGYEVVKHGKWNHGKCTNCQKSLEDLLEGEFYYDCDELHYCPNCGARMDGEVE